MRNHHRTNGSSKQHAHSDKCVGPKSVAHELGIAPTTLRLWLRQRGTSHDGRLWLWSEREAQRIVASYRNGGRRCY
jgi:hypothetical protein